MDGRLDGWMTGRRQKEKSGNGKGELGIRKKTMNEKLGLRFRCTWDIIEAVERGLLPDKIMLNVHPQRWNDRFEPWMNELVFQNLKNVIKKLLVRMVG